MRENGLYSIDRLVEFGLSMGVATQMANSMNVSLSKMTTPGTGSPATVPSLSRYVVLDGRASGPYTDAELLQLIASGQVTKETYVWEPGMPDWKLAEDVPGVLRLVALTPPPIPKSNDIPPLT